MISMQAIRSPASHAGSALVSVVTLKANEWEPEKGGGHSSRAEGKVTVIPTERQ